MDSNDLCEEYQAHPQSIGHEIWMLLEVKPQEGLDQKILIQIFQAVLSYSISKIDLKIEVQHRTLEGMDMELNSSK